MILEHIYYKFSMFRIQIKNTNVYKYKEIILQSFTTSKF